MNAGSIAGDRAFAKLRNVLGTTAADTLIAETLRTLKRESLQTPDDCYAFGNALTRAGGLKEAIGRAIMVQAVLAGAKGS